MTTIHVPAGQRRPFGGSRRGGRRAGRPAFPTRASGAHGSRGLLWLEPLVEVDTPEGRIGYGPVTPSDADSVAQAISGDGAHPLRLGIVENLPWLASQDRLTFARVGVIDPLDADDFLAHGGLAGLSAAIELGPEACVEAILASGLRGRGGAGFPAGIKWRTVAQTDADQKYVCVNADEGDSGTFADRMLMEGDPLTLIEGATIAGLSVGATTGIVYIRSEYPDAIRMMRAAIDVARARGWLGPDVLGSGRAFDLDVRVGAGSYVCGEETAMLESIEGRRGMVRAKPPVPAIEGLFGRPTLIGNVLSIAAVPFIAERGAEAYAGYGTGRSLGTQVFQLAGNVRQGGIVETGFGITLRELVDGYGGGTRSGRPVRAVQVGGPLGAYLSAAQLDVPMDYEALAAAGGMLGHGGVVVFDDTVDMAQQATVRHGVLRRGVMRQVHPLSDRQRARRRGDRPDHRRRPARREPGAARRPVRGDGRRVAVRDGRPDADAGPQRVARVRRGFRDERSEPR